ncbi:hypothetical protein D920_03129 [Enterococcus faecalis 13-SD-W-01]|nr:hypothetical protein D920_03129 [Enterococcus faecalis 13-SD-W-01]
MVALLVLSGVLLTADLLIRQAGKLDETLQRKDYQDWLVFLIQLENELEAATSVKIENNRLIYEKNERSYIIEQHRNMIRRRRDAGGHQPMLMDIAQFEFIEESLFIAFAAEFENGEQEYGKWTRPRDSSF